MKINICSAVARLVFLLASVPTASAQTTFSFTNLGTLGGIESYARAINASGQIVGISADASTANHAVIWEWNGSSYNAAVSLSADNSGAQAINASGQITGFGNLTINTHATIWANDVGHTATERPSLTGVKYSAGYGINASGQVVGQAHNASIQFRAVKWNSSNPFAITELTMLGTGNESGASAINASGQVVGYSRATNNGPFRAVLWNGVTPTDLGALGLGGNFSGANSINDSGQIAGWSYITGDTAPHAAFWNGVTTAIDLGTLPGGTTSYAMGINTSGLIVGYSDTLASGGDHAFLYSNATLYDLNNFVTGASGWTLRQASAINDLGQIVGYASDVGGNNHAFVLTPVAIPEPTAGAAVVASIALLATTAWWRKRAAFFL